MARIVVTSQRTIAANGYKLSAQEYTPGKGTAMSVVYVFDRVNKKAWRIRPSPAWWKKNDNGHMVSQGMELGEDITKRQLIALQPRDVDYEEAQHSGCQSECTRRGGDKCRW